MLMRQEATKEILEALEAVPDFVSDEQHAIILPNSQQQNILVRGRYRKKLALAKIFPADARRRCNAEVSALLRFRSCGLPVAAVLARTRLRVVDGTRPCIFLSLLPGDPLDALMPTLSSAEASGYGRQIAALLARQCRSFTRQHSRHAEAPTLLTDTWSRLAQAYRAEMPGRVPEGFFDGHLRAAATLADPTTLHRATHDWRLRHLLVSQGQVCGLLDLEYTRWNDFAVEVGHFLQDALHFEGEPKTALCGALLNELTRLGLRSSAEFDQRVVSYMAKQALATCLADHRRGMPEPMVRQGLALALRFHGSAGLNRLVNC